MLIAAENWKPILICLSTKGSRVFERYSPTPVVTAPMYDLDIYIFESFLSIVDPQVVFNLKDDGDDSEGY